MPRRYEVEANRQLVFVMSDTMEKRIQRNERDSNTRGQSPVDFESTPLTTRAPLRRAIRGR